MLHKDTVSHKKKFLSGLLKSPLEQLARQCTTHWHNPDTLTRCLQDGICRLPHCQLLYAIANNGQQLSANVNRQGVDNSWHGQNLGQRPFMQGLLPYQGMTLSAAYLSQRSMQPCITALQAVRANDSLLGFVAADFHIKDLPNMTGTALHRVQHAQNGPGMIGMPGAGLRRKSSVDQNIDYLIYVLSTLMQEHGVFHCTLHFGSACAALWALERPTEYQVYNCENLLKADLFHHYPKHSYNCHTRLDADRVPLVFAQLKALRAGDDTNYLRSASVNMISGQIGLSFACDGSLYTSTDEFLNHDINYWLNQEFLAGNQAHSTTPN